MEHLGDRLPDAGRRSRLASLWAAIGHDLGVDLGTANTLVFVRGKGVVLAQPSYVAVDTESGRMIAAGDEAREMFGRAPEHIQVLRPLRSGVITDYDAAQFMLREFILRVHHRTRFVQPRAIVCVPSGATTVERRAVEEAVLEAGARRVSIVSEPLAAAVGAGLPVHEARGSMVVDVGGGTTEVAVLVLGGIVVSSSLRVAGDAIDAAIAAFIRKDYGLLIGERTAERMKFVASAAVRGIRSFDIEVLGRDLMTGRPGRARMAAERLLAPVAEPVQDIVDAVIGVLERLPPELVPDIADRGITLTGGGALLAGLDRRIAIETGVPVHVDPEPLTAVARGAGALLERMSTGPVGRTRPRRRVRVAWRFPARAPGDRDRRRV